MLAVPIGLRVAGSGDLKLIQLTEGRAVVMTVMNFRFPLH